MSWISALAIYFIIWWMVLFMVVPWGIKSQHENEDGYQVGTEPGAPVELRLGLKLLITTLISAAILAIYIFLSSNQWWASFWMY